LLGQQRFPHDTGSLAGHWDAGQLAALHRSTGQKSPEGQYSQATAFGIEDGHVPQKRFPMVSAHGH
jgi:hypothetical protein